MISPTRYNLNFLIFFPLSLSTAEERRYREGFGGSDGLVKEDGFRNAPIFPLDVRSIPSISAANVFSIEGF